MMTTTTTALATATAITLLARRRVLRPMVSHAAYASVTDDDIRRQTTVIGFEFGEVGLRAEPNDFGFVAVQLRLH